MSFRDIALGARAAEIAMFFDSDGETIIHPEPARGVEVPILGPLPEELNCIPWAHIDRTASLLVLRFDPPSSGDRVNATEPSTGT